MRASCSRAGRGTAGYRRASPPRAGYHRHHDGDGTYPPRVDPVSSYVLIEERVDFITARRGGRAAASRRAPSVSSGTPSCRRDHGLLWKFIIDSQSGMWVFRRVVLHRIDPRSDTMALSEEIKILAFTHPALRCLEMPIYYGERIGESKLNLWRDGFGNLLFLARMRLSLGRRRRAASVTPLPIPRESERRKHPQALDAETDARTGDGARFAHTAAAISRTKSLAPGSSTAGHVAGRSGGKAKTSNHERGFVGQHGAPSAGHPRGRGAGALVAVVSRTVVARQAWPSARGSEPWGSNIVMN